MEESMKMPKVPSRPPLPIQYCGKCGAMMKQRPIATYYDHDTGEPYNHWEFKCPYKKWYNFHSSWKCDEDGDTYSYQC